MKPLLLLLPLTAAALITQPSIKPNKKIQPDDLKFMSDLFHGGKMVSSMECEIKARQIQEVKKFKDASKWTESLELEYRPYRYDSSLKETIVVPIGTKYGNRTNNNLSLGRVEEFRVEIGDAYESFIEFSHDGRGNLTGFIFGDMNRLYPCQVKRL